MALEPAFAPSTVWPPPGLLPLEPDDPRLVFPPSMPMRYRHGEREIDTMVDRRPEFPSGCVEPLAPTPARASRQRKMVAAVVVSIALHAALAAFFLPFDEGVKIAGSEDAGIAFLGNAPQDQLASGKISDEAVAEVTIIEMVEARIVDATEAETVPAETVTEPVGTLVAEAPERLEAIDEPVAETVGTAKAEPVPAPARVEPVAEESAVAAQKADTAEPVTEEVATIAPAEIAPEILATDTAKPVNDDSVVQPIAETTEAEAEPVEVVPEERAILEPTPVETPEPVKSETIAEIVPENLPIPEKRPEPEKPVEKPKAEAEPKPDPKPEKKVAERPKAKKPAQKPAKKEEKRVAKAGSSGKNAADARNGEADGRTDGTKARKNAGKGTEKVAGNAAVSNYEGKVRSKVQRSARPPRSKKTGEAKVSFTLSSNGGVSGVRLARSSGSPELDRAALEAVRRAAPFPPIPAGAGVTRWGFSVPIKFR